MFTDNTNMVMLLNRQSSNGTCKNWLKDTFWLCAIYNITVFTKYISTKSNLLADTLSRLPYFHDDVRLRQLLCGSYLCCLDELFMIYRGHKRRGVP